MYVCMDVCVNIIIRPMEAREAPMRVSGGGGIRQSKVCENLSNYVAVSFAHTVNLTLSL